MSAGSVTAGAAQTMETVKVASTKQMNDVQFIIYTIKQSFVALAFLRVISGKFGGTTLDDVLACIIAIVLGFLLRHKTTRRILPAKITALWEPLRRIRKSRVLKLKACVLIDAANYASVFFPLGFKLAFGKGGFTPVGVFLVQYLFSSFSLAAISIAHVWTPAAKFFPCAIMGWLVENRFITKKDLWASARNPSELKRIMKAFFARLKEFYAEEKQRRKAGLSEEEAMALYTSAVGTQPSASSDTRAAAAAKMSANMDAAFAAVEKMAQQTPPPAATSHASSGGLFSKAKATYKKMAH